MPALMQVELHELTTLYARRLADDLGVAPDETRGQWRKHWLMPTARLIMRTSKHHDPLTLADLARAYDHVRDSPFWRDQLAGPMDFERHIETIVEQARHVGDST